MADENIPGNKQNPARSGTGETDKIKLGLTGNAPPKIQLRSADAKKSTTRIDLADVIMPGGGGDDIKEISPEKQSEFFKKSTIRISDETASPAPKVQSPETMRTTMRLDQTSQIGNDTQRVSSSGETGQIDPRRSTIRISDSPGAGSETARVDAKRSTVRVDQPPPGATQQVKGETNRMDVKRSTIRVDGGETQQMQGGSATSRIGGPGQTSPIDVRKSTIRIDSIPQSSGETQRTGTGGETKRIDLKTLETGQMAAAKDQTAQQAAQPGATAKISDTQQQQKMKSETTRLAIPPEVAKRQTGRIQAVDTQDVFKKRTGQIQAAPVSVPPVAPAVPAITPMGKATAADTVARPKTILVRRPGRAGAASEAPAVSAIEPTQQLSQRKSETARLEIPKETGADDRPQTRPKTIRIKRPDGTTARKQLTIARPDEGTEASEIPDKYRSPAAVAAGVSDPSPGGFWAVLAIAATLVLIGLVVYLLAQTHLPDLISSLPGHV